MLFLLALLPQLTRLECPPLGVSTLLLRACILLLVPNAVNESVGMASNSCARGPGEG